MLHPIPHERNQEQVEIELKDLTCGYNGKAVLSAVSLKINQGDFVGLLGPSGSGKTSLLKAILGAIDIYEGDVLIGGVSTSGKKTRAGYVPQLETIDWNFPVTVEEVVMMGRTMDSLLFPWYRQKDKDMATGILDRLSINHLRKRHINELSGGQQQRVFLARALISSPNILLLDEPTAGVDIKTRDDIVHLLHDLNHQGVTILMTTHEINSVAAHLPEVVCMNNRIIAKGPPSEIFTQETFKLTYNADMPVISYQGMTLVAESPHIDKPNLVNKDIYTT